MEKTNEMNEMIAGRAVFAAKKIAPRFLRGSESWRECVGHVVLTCMTRLEKKTVFNTGFDSWLIATCFGEAKKYFRIERNSSLSK